MRCVVLLLALVPVALSFNIAKMPKPPCGIPKEDFYAPEMIEASRQCWSNDYVPCATECRHIRTLLKHYWNTEPKCKIIRDLAGKIPHYKLRDKIRTKQATFPNRIDCGDNNGSWKKPNGEFIATRHTVVFSSGTD